MNILNKNFNLIAYVLMNLRAPKCVVRQMSKKFRFSRPYDKQHGKRSQTLLKCAPQHLYQSFKSMWKKFSWKKALLVICKILGVFVNTLIADGKYSLLNCEELRQRIQKQLLKKQKTFSEIVLHFWNLYQIWNILRKKWPS